MGQFENMTSYLAAPDAQSKKGTEDLFSGVDSPRPASPRPVSQVPEGEGSFITEVGKYIEAVQIYTEDLTRRFEEAKALNEIQLTIIDGLRGDLKAAQQNMQDSLDLNVSQQPGADASSQKGIDSSWESIETAVDDTDQVSNSKAGMRVPTMVGYITQSEGRKNPGVPHRPVEASRRGFWTALYEALDSFSDDLHEP